MCVRMNGKYEVDTGEINLQRVLLYYFDICGTFVVHTVKIIVFGAVELSGLGVPLKVSQKHNRNL